MNKNSLWLIMLLFVASFGFVSCSEDSGVEDPYANWEERNQHYIDSIADVAKQNPDTWKTILDYRLQQDDSNIGQGLINLDVNDYVYAKVLESAPVTSTQSPLFQDTVYVHYRGKLINGEVFDQSYTTENLEPEVALPRSFATNGVIKGWTTALQHMKVGDRWEIHIPADLAYGLNPQSPAIPINSALVFDVSLVKIVHPKGIEPFALAVQEK